MSAYLWALKGNTMQAFINWSGGKDCTLALHKVLDQKQLRVASLFTTISREHQRVSMHGVRKELITRQAQSLGISSRKVYLPENLDMPVYDTYMKHEMALMKQRGLDHVVCGDIFLEDLRKYREEKLSSAGIQAHFPLWKINTTDLLKEFIALGYKAVIVCVDQSKLDNSFLGRELNLELINDLPAHVDPCGENGEYHSFVYDGPIFNEPINIRQGEVVERSYTHEGKDFGFGFMDLTL
ncbi:MAG: diphthine--ammonia ligase [Bacteroidetes bacterium]|nr:diphthine--ammonia ligase [Bacteroidota bacterium]